MSDLPPRGDTPESDVTPGTACEPIQRWLREADVTGAWYHRRYQFPFLDEFVADNVDVHFEVMGHAQFWMAVHCRRTGRTWALRFGAVNDDATKGYSMCEEE